MVTNSKFELSYHMEIDTFTCNLDQGRIDLAELQVASNGAISVDRSWVDVIQRFTGANGNVGEAGRVSLPHVDFGVRVQDGLVRVSNPRQQLDFNIPVNYIAMALTGERSEGTHSIAIMDLFKIPAERIARHPATDNTLHR